ncbi:hypothetical protein ACKI10_43160 [Streptomyces galilaeus]|uniref:XRE family transcriptional regulator n=1 Tax=Streptomyces galilaeus TaxID=33899 RepID=A0ABW9J1A7_STRGJ
MSPASELQPPAEGLLIRLARQARGLSPEAAAKLTPIQISGGRWRQIESGYERKSPPKRAFAPDLTLAHMAHTVGVTPERLAAAGRPEAAEVLQEILRSEAEPQAGASEALSSRELEVLAGIVASAADGFDMSPADLDAAFRRAQQLVQQRRRERAARDGGPAESPPHDRAS